jgi:hypothetical protein
VHCLYIVARSRGNQAADWFDPQRREHRLLHSLPRRPKPLPRQLTLVAEVTEIIKDVHPDAALESSRLERLRLQIEECCPPKPPDPVCVESPCPVPPPFDPPPVVGPDLDSILIRPSGTTQQFGHEATISTGGSWDFKVSLTEPAVDPTFLISLQSSDAANAPVPAATELKQGETSGEFLGGRGTNSSNRTLDVTITATGKRVSKNAALHIIPGVR